MIKLLTKTLPVFIIFIASAAYSQKVERVILEDGSEALKHTFNKEIICTTGPGATESVPLPDHLRKKINARVKTSQFEVNYIGFTEEARESFQYAVDIWAATFDSSVPIRVNATFKFLEAPAIGAAKFSNAFANFKNAPKANTWYQMPIAEKIAGIELNEPTEYDIDIEFNSAHSWYYDTENPDGVIGSGLTDFATVVLHELGHALGFSSFGASVDEDPPNSGNFVGDILLGDFPIVYNTFLVGQDGPLVDLPTPGSIMARALTSGGLRFLGQTSNVRIYSPDPFNPGSSISHIDDINQLMNPSLAPNTYLHDPGAALGVMHDFGWEFTYMNHNSIASTENFNQDFEVVADVFSDAGYDTTSLQLYYSRDGFASDTVVVAMTATGEGNNFSATIPNSEAGVISYFLKVVDTDGRIFTNPGSAPDERTFTFIADIDDSIPEISHKPSKATLLPAESKLDVNASIDDFFTGVDTAYVEWKINDVEQEPIGMIQNQEFQKGWDATINFTSEFSVGDIISYQIIAIDKANSANTAISPGAEEFYDIPVEGVRDPVASYENDFNAPTTDFELGDYTIETPDGFDDGCLNTPHPYENAGEGGEINYVAQLKVPIILDAENSIMTFDEVVLVEPGTNGTTFGDEEFWDYVIVEGSKDDGNNWIALAPGWDSSDNNVWLLTYNGDIVDQNSQAAGTPSLYRERTIDLLDNNFFKDGDTIILQFRLFSDPFAVGWGWAIDNLKIQGEKTVTAISDYLDPERDLKIYPNPSVDGFFNVEARFGKAAPSMKIEVMDAMGRIVHTKDFQSPGTSVSYGLDLSAHPSGIYLVNTSINGDNLLRKVIKTD